MTAPDERDPHTRSAILLFDTPTPTKDQRNTAKRLNVLAAYGKLSDQGYAIEFLGLPGGTVSTLIARYRKRILGVLDD